MKMEFDEAMDYVRKGVTYSDAETRGRLRVWKQKLARDYATFDAAFRGMGDDNGNIRSDWPIELVRCPRAGRRRAFEKIKRALGPGAVLEEVRLEKRGKAYAVWSILKPRAAVTLAAAENASDEERASLAQDCVTLNYIVIGTSDILVTEGLWTLEVPDHALGRAVERSGLLNPETIIRNAHRNLLDLPTSVLTNTSLNGDSGAFIKAGAGCFAGRIGLAADRSGDMDVHVRTKTWLDENQMHDDQIVLSGKGEEGSRLGDGWLKPAPFRIITPVGDGKYQCMTKEPWS